VWKSRVQRASYRLCTVPIYFGIFIISGLCYRPVLDDYEKCCTLLVAYRGCHDVHVTGSLIRTLVIAEDHRNAVHYGVDPLAILRTIKVRIFQGKRQGASTIEQQLVRTITGRYEKTPRRKIREQMLAVMLNAKFGKEELASCYLKIAYYGVSLTGHKGIERIKSRTSGDSDAVIVAHLKYPKTRSADDLMAKKHMVRVEHINKLLRNHDAYDAPGSHDPITFLGRQNKAS